MINRLWALGLVLLCLNFSAGPGKAEDSTVDLRNPFAVSKLLREWGFRADLHHRDGYPTINSGTQGGFFAIDFYWCEDAKICNAMMFRTTFDAISGVALEEANRWNRERVMGRMSIDDDCDIEMTHFVVTGSTVPLTVFSGLFAEWETIMVDVQDLLRGLNFDAKGRVIPCDGRNVPT